MLHPLKKKVLIPAKCDFVIVFWKVRRVIYSLPRHGLVVRCFACCYVFGHEHVMGQERNYNGIKMLEFTERWNLIMMNCDVKCKGTFTRVGRGKQ